MSKLGRPLALRVAIVLAIVAALICYSTLNSGSEEKKTNDLQWSHSPDKLRQECLDACSILMAQLNYISQSDSISFHSIILPMDVALAEFTNQISPLAFYGSVSPLAEVRQAGVECEQQTSKLQLEVFTRSDLYRVVKQVEADKLRLSDIDKKLLEQYLLSFHENGLNLDLVPKARLEALRKELITLESEFQETLTNETGVVHLSKAEIEGLPTTILERLQPSPLAGKDYILTLKYPDYYPAIEYIDDATVRKLLHERFRQRGGQANKARLQKAIVVRHEIARLLGYRTYAHFKLENTMAKTPEAVQIFLKKLLTKLRVKSEREIKELLALKKAHVNDATLTQLDYWDLMYFERLLKETKYQVDQQLLKTYFPLNHVIEGMFTIYEKLLGVHFQAVAGAPSWHRDVKYFEIIEPKTQRPLAGFYMDLFPREGKYGHAAAFTLKLGFRPLLGTYRAPISAIVANVNPPSEGKPALLNHDQVETLFHEFGHIMHQSLSTSIYATFAGTLVKGDFVEAPSQMLENWVWQWEPLQLLSSHYETGARLPRELFQKMLAVKKLDQGIVYLRQLFYASIDLAYHSLESDEAIDTTKLYHDTFEAITHLSASRDTIPEASFGHLMGGYDAGYYGYLWSEVFAQDMFTRFEESGLFNEETGRRYRSWILEPGGSRDPAELLSGFLGRAPSEEAFLRQFE